MHAGQRFAAYLALLLFVPDGTKIRRKQCALFGALVLVLWNVLMVAIALLGHSLMVTPTLEAVPFRQSAAGYVALWFSISMPPVAAFGALGGLIRYQMKQGSEDERAGGGGCLQGFFALPTMLLIFPFIVVILPILLLMNAIFRRDFWGDGTTGWIPAGFALAAALAVAFASTLELGKDEIIVWVLVAIPPADAMVSWIIFSWNAQQRLAVPAERAVSTRFSLGALLTFILFLGLYVSFLVLVLN